MAGADDITDIPEGYVGQPPTFQPQTGYSDIPPGFSPMGGPSEPSQAAAAPAPETAAYSDIPPGFQPISAQPQQPKRPDAPAQTPYQEADAEETPGLMQTLKDSYTRAVARQLTAEAQGLQVLGGRTSPEELYQQSLQTPEIKDAIDRLDEKGLAQGWTSLPWWMHKVGANLGGVTPGLGMALGAGAAFGPEAGVAAFGADAVIGSLVPAYMTARKEGLGESAALKRAAVDSGLAGVFSVAMGVAGKFPVTGTVLNEVGEKILARPLAETFAQFGLVQPGLMAAQDVATSMSHGHVPSLSDLATDMIVGTTGGLLIHGVFKGNEQISKMVGNRGFLTPEGRAAAEALMATGETASQKALKREARAEQGVRPSVEGAPAGAPAQPTGFEGEDVEPEAFTPMPPVDRNPVTREPTPPWYGRAGSILSMRLAENATTDEVNSALKDGGIPQTMLDPAFVPSWLRKENGTVNRDDLIAHVESNSLDTEEVLDPPEADRADFLPGEQAGKRELTLSDTEGDPVMKIRNEVRKGPMGQKTLMNVGMDDLAPLRVEKPPAPGEEQPAQIPIKTGRPELGVVNNLRYAAEHGFDELGFINGDMAALRARTPEEAKTAHAQWDKQVPDAVQKWAKYYGMSTEQRKLENVSPETAAQMFKGADAHRRMQEFKANGLLDKPFNQNVTVVKLNPRPIQGIRQGYQYDKDLDPKAPRITAGHTLSEIFQDNPKWKELVPHAQKIERFMNRIAAELGVTRGIEFRATEFDEPWRGRLHTPVNPATGNYVIDVNLRRILTAHDLYASMSHEFGHVIERNLLKSAPDTVKAAIRQAFLNYLSKITSDQMRVGDVRRMRDNMISLQTGARAAQDGLRLSDLVPRTKNYFLSQEEWFAEQVAKWMTTDEKPLGVADSFFKRLANKLRTMFTEFSKKFPDLVGTPDKAVADFLNKKWSDRPAFAEEHEEQFDMDTQKANQAAIDKEGTHAEAVPQQASTGGGRNIIKNLPPEMRGQGLAMAAHADRMNWFFKLMLSLPQVQELNPHLRELAYYTDMHRLANLLKNQVTGAAERRLQQWGLIRDKEQLDGIMFAMDDYGNGRFKLPHTEDGVFRRPNQEEWDALMKRYKLNAQSERLFKDVIGDFDAFLDRYRKVLIDEAHKIKDPTRMMNSLQNINVAFDNVMSRPFMPMSRYGKYMVTVYAKDGTIRFVEHTNSVRQQKKIAEAFKASPDFLPGDQVLPGMVPKDAMPFMGMPPGLIDLLAEKLQLSPSQRAVVEQLRFDYAPGHSFKHQFRTLDLVPGYSTDFVRNYAHFFFHGANHLARVTYVDQMRDMINSLAEKETRLERIGNATGANKLDQIVKFMQDHQKAWLDPKSDWAQTRGMMFHWYLGFNPATALNNLTQTAMMTYPYLASKFGDAAAIRAIARAGTDLNNFYKKGTILSKAPKAGEANTPENFIARANAESVTRGVITETQSHQLAAVSEDRNILRNFGSKAESFWLKFQEASSWMFEMSEQYNRRTAFNAALRLAYENPGHKLNAESRLAEPLLYKELVDERHWTPQEASAFVTAQRAVSKTQFDYAPWARPAAMRGPIGSTVWLFKLFTQNVLFNLASNPSMAWRSLLVMGALGGMMGLPGADNINSFLKTMAYRLFGKDFDLEDEGRHFARDVLNGYIDPDILMHGLSVKGFGLPLVMHSIGANWYPTTDMSRSVGMGNLLPADPFKPAGPVLDPQHETLRQITNGVGAAFGLQLNIYDFATSNDNFTDLKKYEGWAPRFMGNITHAFRYAYSGEETNRAGNAIVRFDVRDTEQMMEILARAMGMQPRRLTEEWARIQAKTESSNYWTLRKEGLMRQFAETVKSNDKESKDRVVEAIRQYNKQLPAEARGYAITDKGLTASVTQRLRGQQMTDAGLPTNKRDIPLMQEVEKYYPRGWPRDLKSVKGVQ